MFGGVSLPKAISARREVGIVVACGFNIRRTQTLSPQRSSSRRQFFKTFRRNASFRFAGSFPHLAIGSFTRSLSDSVSCRTGLPVSRSPLDALGSRCFANFLKIQL